MRDDIERAVAQAWATGEAFFEVGPDGISGVIEKGREWAEKLASVTDTPERLDVLDGRVLRVADDG